MPTCGQGEQRGPTGNGKGSRGTLALVLGCLAWVWILVLVLPPVFERYAVEPPPSWGLAIATLMVLLLALPLVVGPLAIIEGARAMKRGGPARRRGLVGLLLGTCSLLAPLIALGGPFIRAYSIGQQTSCQSSIEQMGLGLLNYAADHEDRLPLASEWPTAIWPYVLNREVYRCAAARWPWRHRVMVGDLEVSYTMNAALSGVSTKSLRNPEQIGMLWDGTSLAGSYDSAAYRHRGSLELVYADDHRDTASPQQFRQVRLKPDE